MEIDPSVREKYVAGICARRADAATEPFIEVSPEGWTPQVAQCHQNVDRWIGANPGCEAVRGWITYIGYGPCGVRLTAHSVVPGQDGKLFDITPVAMGLSPGGPFIEHQGDPAVFFQMKDWDIHCPSFDPAADEQALCDMIAASGITCTEDDEGLAEYG